MTTQMEAGRACESRATLPRLRSDLARHALASRFRMTADGVVVVDSASRIVLINPVAQRLFGYAPDDLLDQPVDVLLQPEARNSWARHVAQFRNLQAQTRKIRGGLMGRHANGMTIPLNASISRVASGEDTLLALRLFEARDAHRHPEPAITELRRRAVSSQHASELEKRHISRKLYDEIGQRLSVLKLDLAWLENSLSDTDQDFPARVAEMHGLLDHVISMTKNVASALRPPLLDDFGLLAAVEWMATNFQKRHSISCRVESKGMAAKLGDPLESAIFRIIQEALTNIEKHARATKVSISFRHAGDQLNVMIADNGTGMENGSDTKPGCYGLIAMQERVFVLGGTIRIENARPHGVAIHVSIPTGPTYRIEPLSNPPGTRI